MLQFAESREYTVNHLLNPQGLVYFKLILRGGGLNRDGGLSGEAVSYTHLTLPTIYSV